MTKTEAREWIRRIREDMREAEAALKAGDLDAMIVATEDASGSAGELFEATCQGLIRGLK